MLALHRTKENAPSLKQGKIIPHEEISPAQAARAVYLLAGRTAGPRPLLMWPSEVKRLHTLDCLSQQLASSGSELLREASSSVSWGYCHLNGAGGSASRRLTKGLARWCWLLVGDLRPPARGLVRTVA